jgi:hypothetical protein
MGIFKMAKEFESSDRPDLAHEGRAMLRLILGRPPSRCSVGEYIDAIGAVSDGRSLGLRHWALTPVVLTLIQGPILFRRDLMDAVRRRMDIALQIAETEPAPSRYFRTRSVNFPSAALMIIVIAAAEAFRMVCSVTAGSVLARSVTGRSESPW